MSEATNDDLLTGLAERPAQRRLPNHTLSELLIPVSNAIDLAEGRSPGHAQRVAYLAGVVAASMGLHNDVQLACYHAALMHDIGVVSAGAGLGSQIRGDERLLFATLPLLLPEEAAVGASDSPELVMERIIDHVIHGVRAAKDLSLPHDAIRGIASHHEHWDGSGYPEHLQGEDIPVVGRIVGLADQVEAMIDQAGPLLARRNFPFWLDHLAGAEADPQIVGNLREMGSGDLFWLKLFSVDLGQELAANCSRLREPRSNRLFTFMESFAQLIDSRFSFTVGISNQVARQAEALGRALDFTDLRLKQLRVAALLHDVGQLSVSERIMAKPGILSVEELESLRLHPDYSHDVVAGIPGLEDVAEWVAAHHERPDGRGYPDGRSGDEIPLESRILAVADAYVAMTSDRPYRPKTNVEDARRRLKSAAGSQLDAGLVEVFLSRVVA